LSGTAKHCTIGPESLWLRQIIGLIQIGFTVRHTYNYTYAKAATHAHIHDSKFVTHGSQTNLFSHAAAFTHCSNSVCGWSKACVSLGNTMTLVSTGLS